MKLSVNQPVINVTRALLNQEGYTKDFADFYLAGKILSEIPPAKFLPPTANAEQQDALLAEVVEFEIDDKSRDIIKKALKHYIDGKKNPTEHHYRLAVALELDPSKSLS